MLFQLSKIYIPVCLALGELVLSPEYPAEQIWNVLRRNCFANRVFDSLSAAMTQAVYSLTQIASDKLSMKRLSNWPWINAILKS